MPEEILNNQPAPQAQTQTQPQSTQPKVEEDGDKKTWQSMKRDERGNFIVSLTEQTQRAFSNIDEAGKYMTSTAIINTLMGVEGFKKSALQKMSYVELLNKFHKVAGSPEYDGPTKAQEGIDGVYAVHVTYKLVEDAGGNFSVKKSVRTDIAKDTLSDATKALNNVEEIKEDVTHIGNPFKTNEENEGTADPEAETETEVEKESSIMSASNYKAIGSCTKCNSYIYPPDMGNWFNRQIPADTFCPDCGYGDLSEPGAFLYSNPDVQQQAMDDYIIQHKKM